MSNVSQYFAKLLAIDVAVLVCVEPVEGPGVSLDLVGGEPLVLVHADAGTGVTAQLSIWVLLCGCLLLTDYSPGAGGEGWLQEGAGGKENLGDSGRDTGRVQGVMSARGDWDIFSLHDVVVLNITCCDVILLLHRLL